MSQRSAFLLFEMTEASHLSKVSPSAKLGVSPVCRQAVENYTQAKCKGWHVSVKLIEDRLSFHVLRAEARSRQALKAGLGACVHTLVWYVSSAEAALLPEKGDIEDAIFCLASDGAPPDAINWIGEATCDNATRIMSSNNHNKRD